jgi:hypothetical protein
MRIVSDKPQYNKTGKTKARNFNNPGLLNLLAFAFQLLPLFYLPDFRSFPTFGFLLLKIFLHPFKKAFLVFTRIRFKVW